MNSARILVAITALLALPASVSADVWIDQVVSFSQPPNSSNDGGVPTDALGPTDAAYVSIDIPEELILRFTDNLVFDGAGDDVRIWENTNGDSQVDIYGSVNNVDYFFLWRASGNESYDLANSTDLNQIRFMKFVGLDDGGGHAGFDLDSVEAINSLTVPEPTAPLAIAFAGVAMLLRRRR